MSKFRIVVLSSPEFSNRRRLILNELTKQGILINALVLSSFSDSLARRIRTFWKRMRKYGLSFIIDDFLLSKITRIGSLGRCFNSNIPISSLCKNTIYVKSFQMESAFRIIEGLYPDLLILAGVHILPQRILSIPKLGTINSHLGLVPDFRGNYPVHWAIFKRAPVGVTVHWVDSGIDTGPIIYKKVVNMERPGKLEEWVQAVEEQAAFLLAITIRDIASSKISPGEAVIQNPQEGHTYRYMHPKLQRQVRIRLNRLQVK